MKNEFNLKIDEQPTKLDVNKNNSLEFEIGTSDDGKVVIGDLVKIKNLLVSGQTGSGKTTFIDSMILDFVKKYSSSEVKFVIIDTKMVAYNEFCDLQHTLCYGDFLKIQNWYFIELREREKTIGEFGSIENYNSQVDDDKKLPRLVIIIDDIVEIADLENLEIDLAANYGLYFVAVTQNIKHSSKKFINYFKTKVVFKIDSKSSKQLIKTDIAENLKGCGDMLYFSGDYNNLDRLHGKYYSNYEKQKIIKKESSENSKTPKEADDNIEQDVSKYLKIAMRVLIDSNVTIEYVDWLQYKLKISYIFAGQIIQELENRGYISKIINGRRQILMSEEEFKKEFGENL